MMGVSLLVPLTKYYYGDKIKEDDIGDACGMRGGKDEYTDGSGGNT